MVEDRGAGLVLPSAQEGQVAGRVVPELARAVEGRADREGVRQLLGLVQNQIHILVAVEPREEGLIGGDAAVLSAE